MEANKKKWKWKSKDLKHALDTWSKLDVNTLGPSPDEKQKIQIRKLLKELELKIKTLSR